MNADFQLRIDESAALVMERLNAQGFEAYVVGGCVRDAMRGAVPHDWDVTTSALPEQALDLFGADARFHVIPTGLKHGTITCIPCGSHGERMEPVEVTTFRVDGVYTDRRRPDSVRFTASIAEDLARRDFTVNAMAYSYRSGLIDPYGGADDLAAGMIRCVGQPLKRFGEDALRILRALRFASVLGFEIEHGTSDALLALRESLGAVSYERIHAELLKLLSGKCAAEILMAYRPVIEVFLPEVGVLADYGVNAQSIARINRVFAEPCRLTTPRHHALVLAALLAGLPAEPVRAALKRLRFDNRTCSDAAKLTAHHADRPEDKMAVRRLCAAIGLDAAEDCLLLERLRADVESCDNPATEKNNFTECTKFLREIRENNECITLAGLKLTGDDLLKLGASPKTIGSILARLFDAVLNETLPNERDALASLAETMINAEKSACNH